jgi:hypothetical protein
MEINPNVNLFEIGNYLGIQELKPLKNDNLDLEVQRFEAAYRSYGQNSIENVNGDNTVTKLENVIFDKVEDYKASLDKKMELFSESMKMHDEISGKDLLNLQYQMGIYVVEVTAVSSGSDKISDGIITLFQTK